MSTREHLSRALWTLFEPIHAVTYFSTQSHDAYVAAGVPRYWDGYFAGRCAPLGEVTGAPVIALFSGFSPLYVNRALPSVWQTISAERALDVRAAGAEATLRALCPDESVVRAAADALAPVAAAADTMGRALSAANQAVDPGDDPYRILWQAAGTLREHRGDGHVLALAIEGLGGISTIVMRGIHDLDAAAIQKARGWTDDEWQAEVAALTARGLLGADGLTDAGAAAIDRLEQQTNRLAAQPWDHLDDAELLAVARALAPVATSVTSLYPFPNPIGMPQPWDPVADPDALTIPGSPA